MDLDKWSANDVALLPESAHSSTSTLRLTEPEIITTLGLHWNPTDDSFCFKVALKPIKKDTTKQTMLSEIAQLYDPFGWLAPTIIIAKLLMQRLWIQGLDWDQVVDEETLSTWLEWKNQLPQIEDLKIPRWFGTYASSTYYLHGFSDASQRAYSAVIYLVAKNDDELPQVTLLMAKTKVAPLKTLSIPKLELLGAALLARLLKYLLTEVKISPRDVLCWTDSTVTLAWLSDHPSRWNTFAANKTSEILTLLPTVRWSHVKSKENPADVASRGILPAQLLNEQLWWTGPSWLTDSYENWPQCTKKYGTELEERKESLSFATNLPVEPSPIEIFISKYSLLRTALLATAYLLRWKRSFLNKKQQVVERARLTKPGAGELATARAELIRSVQDFYNDSEKQNLMKKKKISMRSPLRRLLPFLDAGGILRVGGRLQNSYLGEGEKHPIIIPGNSALARLMISDAHERTLHGGPQLVLSVLQRACWIIRARNKIRAEIKRCTSCRRFQGRRESQQMVPLPAVRVTPAPPFYSTGLDYAGPFYIRTTKGRGFKAYKVYVAIFVCMVTRAIHIEPVSDYTLKTFLQAFRRFTPKNVRPGPAKLTWRGWTRACCEAQDCSYCLRSTNRQAHKTARQRKLDVRPCAEAQV